MINLFEYQNKQKFKGSFQNLENFLDDIWNKREKHSFYYDNESDRTEVQRFIQFIHRTKELKSEKYVGIIHFGGRKINFVPRIFYDYDRYYASKGINAIRSHILFGKRKKPCVIGLHKLA